MGGDTSPWVGILLSRWGGTLLNVQLDIGMSPLGVSPITEGPEAMRGGRRCGLWSEAGIASSGTGSERAQGRELRLRGPPGLQRSVLEEAVYREGRCAASGEAPDRGVPTAVRRGQATKPERMQRPSNAGI